MKKILYCLFICLVFIVICGCGKKSDLKNTYEVEFESNPSTGYTWSYSMSENGILNMTRDEFISADETENIVGAPGKQLYEFTGVKKGEVTITFTYSRQWEAPSLDASGFTYKFKVDKDLNVELISKDEWIS